MRRPVPMRLDPDVPTLEVIAPPNIRSWVPLPMPGETKAERERREAVFRAVLDASGH